MIKKSIKDGLRARAYERIPVKDIARLLDTQDFIVAGNSLNKAKPNDFDIYGFEASINFSYIRDRVDEYDWCRIICETQNALTVEVNKNILQFCKYLKRDVQKLIESFDFSHCQVAVHIHMIDNDTYSIEPYYTEDWLYSKSIESSFYTVSEYPLSSLMRARKYAERGMFTGNSYMFEVLKILTDIIERGFENYYDFKDQLDAIDLQLLKDDSDNDVGYDVAMNLYNACGRRGLVKEYESERD